MSGAIAPVQRGAVSAGARVVDTFAQARQLVAAACGWWRVAIAFGAGALSALAMAPFFVTPVLFVTLPVLVWLIDASDGNTPRARFLRAAGAGWWFGFGYFLLGLFWVGEAFLVEADRFAWLMPFAVVMLPGGLALFTGAATGIARLVWPGGFARVLVLALAIAMAEWLRGHVLTGFPWNVLGYALTWPLELMQSASLLGIYGLTLLAVTIFAGPAVVVADGKAQAPTRAVGAGLGLAVLPMLALYAYGAWRMPAEASPMLDGVKVRIVQASVPQRDKWRPEKQREIFEDQLALSRRDASGKQDDLAGITHLIWPEAAMPFLPLEHPEALNEIGKLLPDGTQLLSGALRVKHAESPVGGQQAFNSLMVFGPNGALEHLYDKIHLVPFGEYLPMQSVLESIGLEQLTRWRGGFSTGVEPRPLLSIAGLPPVAGLICYEAIFPASIVQGAQRPGLIVNVTNDGWFGDTTGPWQHFHQTRVRAVEEGLPIIRAANNGVSAVVDPYGRVTAMLMLNERGVVDSGIPASIRAPVYAQFHDCTSAALALIFLGASVLFARRRRD
ncbi:apolipoprotein N-acyltransferase [Hyphomicrobium sp. NDB2Meth4]|uniref:apolipoprotein N-acyltransferase n=1 Tax=Hyphomicrobium sp. NDB2Meth4 TaxID=1892846 RepID=UPI0009F842C3|nr:apolipoprotein N-acyltransferase [Hyphomicrobium sp. NDB2Meth4]